MKRTDALVVGAGVAGAAAALGLARMGLGVTLVDRAALPRHKVCGCCLNREAMEQLEQLRLGPAINSAGAVPIRRVVVGGGGRATHLSSVGCRALSRYKLDGLLADAAERAGCEVLGKTSAKVCGKPGQRSGRTLVRCSGAGVGGTREIQAGVVLVADGLAGSCLSEIDCGGRSIKPGSLRGYGARLDPGTCDLPSGEIVMRCGAAGYVGTVVLEDGSLDTAAAMRQTAVKDAGGPGAAAQRIAQQAGLPLPAMGHVKWQATAPLTGHRPRLSMPGVMVLGDAAGYVEPFTGEGMAWALRSARAAVPIAADAIERGWETAHAEQWAQAYRKDVSRRQWRCRLFSAILRRPTLTAMILATARHLPERLQSAASSLALPPVFQSPKAGSRSMEQRTCL